MCVSDALLCEAPGNTTTRRQDFAVDVSNMEFMRLSTIKTDDRVHQPWMVCSRAPRVISASSSVKAVKMNNLSRVPPIVDGFIASNDALIAASHLHHLGRLFINKGPRQDYGQKPRLFDRLAFVSIQSARLTGTRPVWRWTVCRILAHAVWRLITDYREYRPLVSSVRVRRQGTGVSGSSSASDSGSGSGSGSLRASLPSIFLPFRHTTTPRRSDPVDGNDMDEDDYEGRTYRRWRGGRWSRRQLKIVSSMNRRILMYRNVCKRPFYTPVLAKLNRYYQMYPQASKSAW
jgi:hypothetical protein